MIRLDVIKGNISILSIRIRISPGNERIIIVSVDGFFKRNRNPSNKPKKTPAMVNVRSRLFRREPQKLPQHWLNQIDLIEIIMYQKTTYFSCGWLIIINSCSWWMIFIIEHCSGLIMLFAHIWTTKRLGFFVLKIEYPQEAC